MNKSKCGGPRIWVVTVLFTLLVLAGGRGWPSTGREVTRQEFGDRWPFTVERGVVICLVGHVAVFRAGGVTYALNGLARQRGGYADIRPIWLDDPEYPGLLKVSLGPILDAALDLCK